MGIILGSSTELNEVPLDPPVHSLCKCGSHTSAAYSNCGLMTAVYNLIIASDIGVGIGGGRETLFPSYVTR